MKEERIEYKGYIIILSPWRTSGSYMYTIFENEEKEKKIEYLIRTKGPAGDYNKALNEAKSIVDRRLQFVQEKTKIFLDNMGLLEGTRADDLIKQYGPNYPKYVEKIIFKNNLSKGGVIKFENDPKQYIINNISPDRITVFVTGINGLGIWNKRIDKIISLNGRPIMKEANEIIFAEEKFEDKNSIETKLKNFIKNNANLSDEVVHNFAKENNLEPSEVKELIYKLTYKLLNTKELKEMNSNEGLSKGMSINDIAIKHKISVNVIKHQLAIGIPKEAKEHTYDLAKAKKVAMDHLVENPYYYDPYLKDMEAKAEQNLKTKPVAENVLKEAEPVDTDKAAAEEPTPIVSEETQAKIDLKRDINDVVSSIEDIIINSEDWNNAVPIKINVLERLSAILKAINSLYLDLNANTQLFSENKEKNIKVAGEEEETRQLLLDKKRKLIIDELKDFEFSKEDVETVVASHYKIESKEDNILNIIVRNPQYNPKSSISRMNYEMRIFFDNNYVGVYPVYSDAMGEKLALQIEKEIIQDLAFINAYELPDEFVQRHAETLIENENKLVNADNILYNDIIRKILFSQYRKEKYPKFIINKIDSNQEEQQDRELVKTDEGQLFEYEYVETYYVTFNGINHEVNMEFRINAIAPRLISKQTREYEEKWTDIEIVNLELVEILVDGEIVQLEQSTKELIKNTIKPNFIYA